MQLSRNLLMLLALGASSAWPRDAAASEIPAVALEARLATPVALAGAPQTTFLKVEVSGSRLKLAARPAVNLAIVIDKSGSMAGSKMDRAREAAVQAVTRLAPNDIVSVIAYDTTVRVVVPATKASDREVLIAGIRTIRAEGDTALFAGVAKAAGEVRKFLDRGRVNRIILLSDGLANVGPSSPAELGGLGASLRREGISVTTFGLGLGYNEDLMTSLARHSDGNHAFIEDAANLGAYFDLELGTALAVVAQDLELRVVFAEGVRPLRVLGRAAEIIGGEVVTSMNQVYALQKQHLVVEVELPPGVHLASRPVASVRATYSNLGTRATESASREVSVSYAAEVVAVERATDRDVIVSSVELIANEQNRLAVKERDEGRVDVARDLLKKNARYLRDNATRWSAPKLDELNQSNEEDASNLEGESWNRQRKVMRKKQIELELQQAY